MKNAGEKIRVLDPRGQPSGIFGRNLNPGDDMMAITDPAVQPTVSTKELEHLHMAPRLKTLENKRIMLIDTGFAGSHEFMEEVQIWFAKNMPAVKTEIRVKPGNTFADAPEFWPAVKKDADGVIIGVGG
jgi:hypothetical protein